MRAIKKRALEAGFELVEGFNRAGEKLIVLLAPGAGLHPAVEGPRGKDEDRKLHGTSGRGVLAIWSMERVYRESAGGR
jgi:hypothetical protein